MSATMTVRVVTLSSIRAEFGAGGPSAGYAVPRNFFWWSSAVKAKSVETFDRNIDAVRAAERIARTLTATGRQFSVTVEYGRTTHQFTHLDTIIDDFNTGELRSVYGKAISWTLNPSLTSDDATERRFAALEVE